MPEPRTLPGIGLTGAWPLGSDGWKPAMDLNLITLSAVTQLVVASYVTALPGSPTDGMIYLVPAGAGANAHKVAIRDEGVWVYVTPREGWIAWVLDTDTQWRFDGAAWIENAGSGGGAGILSGTVDPTTEGVDGEFYLNTTTTTLFGPKAAGVWPAGVPLIGPPGTDGDDGAPGAPGVDGDDGAPGAPGANGLNVLHGTVAPTTQGVDGEFFINTTTSMLYGPKAGGVWPAGVSLIGPAGTPYPVATVSTKTANYNTVSADFSGNKTIRMQMVADNTLTVDAGMSGIEPLRVYQQSTGSTLIVAGAGVTIYSAAGMRLRKQYSMVTLTRINTDVYFLSGDLMDYFGVVSKTANYATVNADFGGDRLIRMNLAGANTFTVDPSMANGEPLAVTQAGAGQTTIVAGAGVTLVSSNGLKLRAQNSVATIMKIGADSYLVSGDLTV